MAPRPAGKASYVVIALGSNVHIFARPHRRAELAHCFETVLGSPVRTVEFPGIDQPMLVVSFPGGGDLSIEFTDAAPDDEQPRLGAWLGRARDRAGQAPRRAARILEPHRPAREAARNHLTSRGRVRRALEALSVLAADADRE
jgi:hypothetical protein